MSPLARIVLINIAWRFGVQLPAFALYRVLTVRPPRIPMLTTLIVAVGDVVTLIADILRSSWG